MSDRRQTGGLRIKFMAVEDVNNYVADSNLFLPSSCTFTECSASDLLLLGVHDTCTYSI
jgi:hypothetical protein